MTEPYEPPEAGGVWEHRSGDCETHGINISFAKRYHTAELHRCVECMQLARVLEWMPE